MKIYVEGKSNKYYIQTLCTVFFPGVKFSEDEVETEDTPVLRLSVSPVNQEVVVKGSLSWKGTTVYSEKKRAYGSVFSNDRTEKMVIGSVVMDLGHQLLGYRPSWGILTGVRPAKVVMEMMRKEMSNSSIKKILTSEYMVNPKKAALAIDVAGSELKVIGKPSLRDCSVYISIPFCPSRCSYCSFVSYSSAKLLSLIPDYLLLLSEEIKELFRSIHDLNLHVKTVYVGGGTPTILSAEQMRFLFSAINECTDVSQLEEFTYESGRPDTITKEKLQVAREYGVTRICVNPQTLCNEILGQVERHHTAEDFLRAFTLAKESGIPSINTDLIAGLPGDNFITFSNSMDRILELKPSNITVHTFCIKRSAEIKNKRKDIYTNHGEDTGKCVDYSQIRAVHDGYHPYYMYRQKNTVGNYENVGFAQPGCEGLYNVYMMEEVHSIFSAGAGAVTKLVDYRMDSNGKVFIERLFNPKYPYEYLRKELTGERYKKIEEFYLSRGLL